ncbi:hypothetical protein GCM10009676_15140 [Prauserella halophila]|uniref:NB-ARC domain-containing protein n=1 Tax=Prauserella halophila TaxID=185641 RepID=A0ABN1W5U3_9PSEU|nr:NB-ARC domain-containing protein [Prauserella halophila]MCP2236278.1 transcriptional activator domain-containing protein [Prauserella halophila]
MTGLHRCGRTGDALAVYRSFRNNLIDSLGIDPSRDMQQLHQSILTSEPAVPAATPAAPPAPRLRTSTRALQHEPSDFVGRDGELAMAFGVLAESADQDGPTTACMINGPSGAGKTTLALRAGRMLRSRFPDHQLLVQLGGKSTGPPVPMEALGSALGKLGLPSGEHPDTLQRRIDVYQSMLAGTRTLVVLDDAADEQQVRSLDPGAPGCGMLVTSRCALPTLEGTTRIPLDAFSPGESVELLEKIAGASRVAAEYDAALRIAELCGRLPVAIRICGAILAARQHWTLAQLADRLADPARRIAELRIGDLDIRSFLAPAHDRLPARGRRALDTLATLGTRSFTCATAAGLLDEPVATTLDLIDELVAAHLLVVDPAAPGHYRLPELVVALAAGESPLRQPC